MLMLKPAALNPKSLYFGALSATSRRQRHLPLEIIVLYFQQPVLKNCNENFTPVLADQITQTSVYPGCSIASQNRKAVCNGSNYRQ